MVLLFSGIGVRAGCPEEEQMETSAGLSMAVASSATEKWQHCRFPCRLVVVFLF